MAKYPEHEKLKEIRDQSQKCGEFYEWLQSEHAIEMECHYAYERDEDGEKVWRDRDGNIVEEYVDPSETYYSREHNRRMKKMRDELGIDCRLVKKLGGPITMPIRQTLTSLLAEFFGIDEKKLEEEKRAMLDECRKAHTRSG